MPQPFLNRDRRPVRVPAGARPGVARAAAMLALGLLALPFVPVRAANLPQSQPALPSSSRFT